MKMILFSNKSPKQAVTKELTQILVTHVNVKQDSGMDSVNPIIQLSSVPITKFMSTNYCMLEVSSDRQYYYYVDKITLLHTNYYQFELTLDVLMTYRAEILEQTALIKRQEYEFNMFITDGALKTYANPKFQQKIFPHGFNTNSFILTVQG